MKKETRIIPLKTLKKYYSFLRGPNRRFRFGNDVCSICHEDLNNSTYEDYPGKPTGGICTLNCKHTFHCSCINEWYSTGNSTCPLCRAVQIPTRELPVIVAQRSNRNLLSAFDEVRTPPRERTPPSRYGSLGLVRSSPPRLLRRSNALTPEEEEAFDNTGNIGAQMMEYQDYPDDTAFDSPVRVLRSPPTRSASGSRNPYF